MRSHRPGYPRFDLRWERGYESEVAAVDHLGEPSVIDV